MDGDGKGYDCLQIPGAAKGTKCDVFTVVNADVFCGNSAGLPTQTNAVDDTKSGTVCSKYDVLTFHVYCNSFIDMLCKMINKYFIFFTF